jgi:hypothetical protein
MAIRHIACTVACIVSLISGAAVSAGNETDSRVAASSSEVTEGQNTPPASTSDVTWGG